MFNSKKLCDVASEMLAEQVKIWNKVMIGPREKSSLLSTDCATRIGSFRQISHWITQLHCSVTWITLMAGGLTKISLRNICELQAAVTKHKCDGFDKSILAGKLGRSDQWQQSCKQHVTADLICQSRDDETTHKQSAKKKKEGGGAARARTIHFSSKYGLWE